MKDLKETYLCREIHEQPRALQRLLDSQTQIMKRLVAAIGQRRISHAVIAARGTSDNAGRYGQYVLGACNGLTVALATPSLFSIYKQPPALQDALVLGISQSGKSPDIVAVLAEAQRQGALTAVFTNEPDSELARVGDFVVNLSAGVERAVAATKTYSCELAALALLSATLARDETMWAALQGLPGAVARTLEMEAGVAACAPRYRYMRHAVVIGRGYNYATAFELALKLKELTYALVEPYSSADFLHGPIAMLEPGFPALVVAPAGKLAAEITDFIHSLHQREAEVVVIGDVPEALALARIPLALPVSVPEWLSPLTMIVPGQLLALHLAHTKGYDVDSPRAIRKVTETR